MDMVIDVAVGLLYNEAIKRNIRSILEPENDASIYQETDLVITELDNLTSED